MRTLILNNPEKAKFLMIFLASIISSAIILALITFKVASRENTPLYSRKNATISLDNVSHTETKEGVKQWSLEAETADYFKKENTAFFTKIKVRLFSETNDTTVITANKGELDTDSGNITLTENVLGINAQFRITTEKLVYNKKLHAFFSDARTTIFDDFSNLSGDNLELYINTEKLSMSGNVSVTYANESKSYKKPENIKNTKGELNTDENQN
jgi:lipopolysaccharide export system protein LptC